MNRTINKSQSTSIESNATGQSLGQPASTRDAVYEVLSVTNLNASANSDASEQTVEVLYQRLGSRWYAFSMVGDEVFFSQVDAAEAERRLLRDSAAIDTAEAAIESTTSVLSGQA